MFIQSIKEISIIIVTDDYVIRNEKILTIFFILIFNELLNLKLRTNGNIERRGALLWTVRASTFSLRSHRDLFAFVRALPRLSDQKISI